MKKIIHTAGYYFDYYIGYFLSSRSTDKWIKRMIEKYPEHFLNEIKYLQELNQKQTKMANIYYFSTEWCGPCKMFKPVVQEVMGQTGRSVQFVDAQHNREMAAKYGVSSVPAIVIEDGHNVVKLVGPQSKTKLLELFSR